MTSDKLEVGDKVMVLDSGLAMLRAVMKSVGADPGPNNLGWVAEFREGGDVLVRFPIGDDDPDEHSQVAPYPRNMVRKHDWGE